MQYPKIKTVFKRNPETKYKTLLEAEYSLREFEYLANCRWVFTEKVNGSNTHIIWDGNKASFQGKTEDTQIPGKLISFLMDRFTPYAMRAVFGETPVHVFGEGYGGGIQQQSQYGPDQKVVLFDVKIGDWWLKRDDLEQIAAGLGIEIVPIVDTGTLYDLVDLVREGFKSHWGDFIAEGIVAKPTVALNARDGSRIITKLKYRDFGEKR